MNIVVVGCAGRMGRMLIQQIMTHSAFTLIGGTEDSSSNLLGQDIGLQAGVSSAGIPVTSDPLPLFKRADVVIDFTVPNATVAHTELAIACQTAMVIGTTGLTRDQEEGIHKAAKHVPIVYAANMSIGISLLAWLVEQVVRRVDHSCDIEILEMHHRHKCDAPSGTALMLGRTLAAGRGVELDQVAILNRDQVSEPRPQGGIGITSLRGGDVISDHTVIFAEAGQRIEITHKATSRHIYATGAITAALWTQGRSPGLYTIADVRNRSSS